jgi:hypothetical protein
MENINSPLRLKRKGERWKQASIHHFEVSRWWIWGGVYPPRKMMTKIKSIYGRGRDFTKCHSQKVGGIYTSFMVRLMTYFRVSISKNLVFFTHIFRILINRVPPVLEA